jgi:hypothetical protein
VSPGVILRRPQRWHSNQSGEDKLEHVDWEEWFDAFDSNNLALLYQEQKSSGEDRGCNTMPGS